jgi:hypothetical protein
MTTFDEFKNSIYEGIEKYPINWRLGQKVFNYIDEIYGIARKIQFNDYIDCFYNDDYIPKFLERAYHYLYTYPALVYQVQLGKDISCANLRPIATYSLEANVWINDQLDHIYHLCNYSEWSKEPFKAGDIIKDNDKIELKITEHFGGYAGSDLIVQSPISGWYYAGLIDDWGWKLDLNDAIQEILKHPPFTKVKILQK